MGEAPDGLGAKDAGSKWGRGPRPERVQDMASMCNEIIINDILLVDYMSGTSQHLRCDLKENKITII